MASGSSAMSLIATTKYWNTGPSSVEAPTHKTRFRQKPMTYADNFNYMGHFYKPMIEYLDKKIHGITPISKLEYPKLPLTSEAVQPDEPSGIRRANSYTKAQINRFISTTKSRAIYSNPAERKQSSYLAKNYSFGKLSVQHELLTSSPTINKYASSVKKNVKFEPSLSLLSTTNAVNTNEGCGSLIKRIHSFSSFTDKAREDVKKEIESTELRTVLDQCKRNYEQLAQLQPEKTRFRIGNPEEDEIKHWKDLSDQLSIELELTRKKLTDTETRAREEISQLRKQLQNEVATMANNMEKASKTNESLVERSKKLVCQNKDLRSENEQLRSALQNSTEVCNFLQLKFQRLMAEYGDLQSSAICSKRFQKRAEELCKEAREQSDEFTRLMILKTRLQNEKAEHVTSETKHLNAGHESVKSFEHLKVEMEKIQRLYHGEQIKVMELENKNKILLAELTNLESKLVNLEKHLLPRGKILNNLESKLISKEDELRVERKKSEAFTKAMTSKDKRIQELHNNLELGTLNLENLQHALDEVEKKANAYKKQLQDLNPSEIRLGPIRIHNSSLRDHGIPYKTQDRNSARYELPKIRRSMSYNLAQSKSGM